MILVGDYAILGNYPGVQELPRISKVILDTNVVADLTDFYFGTQSVDRDSLRKLLLMFPKTGFGMHQVDISYSMAEQETFWSRTGELTAERASRVREIRHAMSRIVEWTPQEVEKWFASRRPPVDRDRSWPSPPIPETDRGGHPLAVLIGTYAILLYVSHLDRTRNRWKHNNRGPAWPIRVLRDWAKDTLGLVGAYEIALAVTLFLDRGVDVGRARKLLGLGNAQDTPDEVAKKAWNAAWDVWFVRVADGATFGLLPIKQETTFVITHDKDTKFVRSGNQVKVVLDDGQNPPLVGAASTWSTKLRAWDELEGLLEVDFTEADQRRRRDFNFVLEQALAALNELEVEMGIEQLTVDAYRRFPEREA